MPDFLRMVAGAASRAEIFPQLFPIPDAVADVLREWKSELTG